MESSPIDYQKLLKKFITKSIVKIQGTNAAGRAENLGQMFIRTEDFKEIYTPEEQKILTEYINKTSA